MQESFRILFHENGDPVDPRCIERFIWAFPKSYRDVVGSIIQKSERLDEEVFGWSVARLMPSFGMARRGAFHGVRLSKNDAVIDKTGVIDLCWKQIGDRLQTLKEFINEESCPRNRVLVSLTPDSEDYVIKKSSKLFEDLRKVVVKTRGSRTSRVGPVGASKVLFAVLPEITLPVNNAEWRYVFKTKEYRNILLTMITEIKEWEKKTGDHLETSDPHPKATLPGIYNIMAMSVRDMLKTIRK